MVTSMGRWSEVSGLSSVAHSVSPAMLAEIKDRSVADVLLSALSGSLVGLPSFRRTTSASCSCSPMTAEDFGYSYSQRLSQVLKSPTTSQLLGMFESQLKSRVRVGL